MVQLQEQTKRHKKFHENSGEIQQNLKTSFGVSRLTADQVGCRNRKLNSTELESRICFIAVCYTAVFRSVVAACLRSLLIG